MKHALFLMMVMAVCLDDARSGELDVRKQFIEPRADQATVPLWFVNGKLTKEEITRQIEDATLQKLPVNVKKLIRLPVHVLF